MGTVEVVRLGRDMASSRVLLELFSLVQERLAGVHGLHTQHLVVALFVVKHAGGEIVEHVVISQGPVGLGSK